MAAVIDCCPGKPGACAVKPKYNCKGKRVVDPMDALAWASCVVRSTDYFYSGGDDHRNFQGPCNPGGVRGGASASTTADGSTFTGLTADGGRDTASYNGPCYNGGGFQLYGPRHDVGVYKPDPTCFNPLKHASAVFGFRKGYTGAVVGADAPTTSAFMGRRYYGGTAIFDPLRGGPCGCAANPNAGNPAYVAGFKYQS